MNLIGVNWNYGHSDKWSWSLHLLRLATHQIQQLYRECSIEAMQHGGVGWQRGTAGGQGRKVGGELEWALLHSTKGKQIEGNMLKLDSEEVWKERK